eukprot:11411059-Karenia_brevis.AAC.1
MQQSSQSGVATTPYLSLWMGCISRPGELPGLCPLVNPVVSKPIPSLFYPPAAKGLYPVPELLP